MAIIKISELRPAGSDLFQDSESFLNELTDQEMEIVVGGWFIKALLRRYTVETITTNRKNGNTAGRTHTNTVGRTHTNKPRGGNTYHNTNRVG